MLEQHATRANPGRRCPFAENTRATCPRYAPRQNGLLAALPVQDYARLLPHLEPVALPRGWTIHGAGDREQHLYFITEGIVSRFHVTENGASAEFAVTGSEGLIGVASFLGCESTPSQAVVLSAGYSYRLGAGLLREWFEREGPLPQMLMRYTQALMAQTGQISVCNRHHSLEKRLCRWILSCLDRLPSNELMMTHELIAHMLGVRREGVTEAAARLQAAGLIRQRRGCIAALDRPRLLARACECYSAVKREYDRLLRPQNNLVGPVSYALAPKYGDVGEVPAHRELT